jgi:hypothetical protein
MNFLAARTGCPLTEGGNFLAMTGRGKFFRAAPRGKSFKIFFTGGLRARCFGGTAFWFRKKSPVD